MRYFLSLFKQMLDWATVDAISAHIPKRQPMNQRYRVPVNDSIGKDIVHKNDPWWNLQGYRNHLK
jgi:hypothetical protein